jgi:hypothetical protein
MVIEQYKSKGLLLDSSLLLLHLVGSIAPALIGQKPLGGFDLDQFRSLQILISRFSRVVTTAHVLTEVSNHVNKFSLDAKTAPELRGRPPPRVPIPGPYRYGPERAGRTVSGRHQCHRCTTQFAAIGIMPTQFVRRICPPKHWVMRGRISPPKMMLALAI